jgi:imidazolonepropionase-like amidohydrolase
LRLKLLLALAACSLLGAADRPIAIEDVTVVDVTTASLHPHQTVLIEGERIAATGARVPAGARVVRGRGKFLIPGLWDMHVHLWYKENQLPLFIAFGVTGVRDMGSDFERTSAWRAAIEKGEAIGPHIVTSGPVVDGEAADNGNLPVIVARNGPEARRAFDRLWNMNVDFIRVGRDLPFDSYMAIAELARHWDLPIEGQIPNRVPARQAIEARQASIEHLDGVTHAVSTDDEAIAFFEDCALHGVSLSPTLVKWQRMAHQNDAALQNDPRLRYVPASIRKGWPKLASDDDVREIRKQRDNIYRLVSLATQTKVQVLAGTDTGDPYTIPGATLDDELEQLVAAGMTPHQALEAATIGPARFLGWDDNMGSIETGKVADLVLLDANPLDDIRNVRKVAAVFARGRYFSRPGLDAILGGAK